MIAARVRRQKPHVKSGTSVRLPKSHMTTPGATGGASLAGIPKPPKPPSLDKLLRKLMS